MKAVVFLLCFIGFMTGHCQSTDSDYPHLKEKIHLSAYLEFYSAVDQNQNYRHQRPLFLYNNTRSGEIALNLGYVKAALQDGRLRANFAMMAGSYVQRNLATEAPTMQNIYEANVGLRLSSKRNVWLDVGVMNSHIGMESAVGALNPTVTRSICAENSPYYETGAKVTYISRDSSLTVSALVLNGWQRMYKLDGNYYPAAGLQINYKFGNKLQINYSNYIGDESPDEDYGMRFFNDLYFMYTPTKRLVLYGAFDAGMQPDFSNSDWPMRYWMGWFGIAQFKITNKFSVSGRMEQYNDADETIVSNYLGQGFFMNGYSVNVDYRFNERALVRLEAKSFQSANKAFESQNGAIGKAYNGLTAAVSITI